MKQTEIGWGMQNRSGQNALIAGLRQPDVDIPACLEYGKAHHHRSRGLFHLREVHSRGDAIGWGTGSAFLAALLGVAAIVIRAAGEHGCTRQTWASQKYEDQNQTGEK